MNVTVNSSSGYGRHVVGLDNPALDGALIILTVLIVLINSVVIYLFFTREYLQTKTNSILVSLAVSDLMIGLLGIPLNITCNAFRHGHVCAAATIIYRLQAVSEMTHIFATTLERYVYVMFPMKYIHIVTAPRVLKLLSALWLTSLFVSLIQLSWQDPNKYFFTPKEQELRALYGAIYNVVGAVFFFLLPLIIMMINYSRMFMVIHRQIKEIRMQHYPRSTSQRPPVATEARAISIFALMLFVFTLCWSSWYVMAIMFYAGHQKRFPPPLLDTLDFLRFSTAFINPILYTFLKRDFARALKSLWVRRDGVRPGDLMSSTRLRSLGFASSLQTRASGSYGEENPVSGNGSST